ncbi:Uncharacterized protein PHSC3_001792 [Chlamydiales bacterium STE3]|nr:Uncharacterized protein PHSC3_001792 [Chlamydiales bacterium STE3]
MKIAFTIISSLCLISSLSGEIKEIHNLYEVESSAGLLGTDDLILFDIDYTLTEPTSPALQMATLKKNKLKFSNELAAFSPNQKHLVPLLMVTQTPSQLTEPNLPILIQKLQNTGATVLGFTATNTFSIPQIGSVPQWRKEELERLGIHFIPSGIVDNGIVFFEFASFMGSYPLYQDGILHSNAFPSKGSVLRVFLDYTSKKPSRIILVDDNLENLQSVENELRELGIAFLGLHYRAQHQNTPYVTDEEWKLTWELIHQRADLISNDRVYIMSIENALE